MPYAFYSDINYRKGQSERTKENWKNGLHNNQITPLEARRCRNSSCKNIFKVKPFDPKKFCSHNCSAHITNMARVLSLDTRNKISKAISSLPRKFWERKTKEKITITCAACKKKFKVTPYLAKGERARKYCCNRCAITTIGRRTTSPKASKGKPGIRADVSPSVCFYSTWEANIARVFNLVGLKWIYAPKIFDLGEHTYRPDFYLPEFDTYIEVKNFMGDYSLNRDQMFRKIYPDIKLELILKKEYSEIKSNYKHFIKNWEF